ncbi:MAG: glycine zipper 2TM domain-containing protein [Alphaproteobacteria bacterium]|nr:glycine zipper 2TM domain-containing protein [Alphaproteobacteria bacterium]MBQ9235291.1 glycine zipper 2TM domain-containing protein [Alphaproteobacteria bacterium]
MKKRVLSTGLAVLALAACAPNINSNHYATSGTGSVGQAMNCTVVSVRQVNVSSSDSSAGSIIGAVGGGVAGSTIGHGRGALLGALGGAALGGIAGNYAQEGLTSQSGVEYIVKLDNGNMRTITQGTDVYMQPGQRCFLLYGDQSRVIPAN